jgi:hypothetical protein
MRLFRLLAAMLDSPFPVLALLALFIKLEMALDVVRGSRVEDEFLVRLGSAFGLEVILVLMSSVHPLNRNSCNHF